MGGPDILWGVLMSFGSAGVLWGGSSMPLGVSNILWGWGSQFPMGMAPVSHGGGGGTQLPMGGPQYLGGEGGWSPIPWGGVPDGLPLVPPISHCLFPPLPTFPKAVGGGEIWGGRG